MYVYRLITLPVVWPVVLSSFSETQMPTKYDKLKTHGHYEFKWIFVNTNG